MEPTSGSFRNEYADERGCLNRQAIRLYPLSKKQLLIKQLWRWIHKPLLCLSDRPPLRGSELREEGLVRPMRQVVLRRNSIHSDWQELLVLELRIDTWLIETRRILAEI